MIKDSGLKIIFSKFYYEMQNVRGDLFFYKEN